MKVGWRKQGEIAGDPRPTDVGVMLSPIAAENAGCADGILVGCRFNHLNQSRQYRSRKLHFRTGAKSLVPYLQRFARRIFWVTRESVAERCWYGDLG